MSELQAGRELDGLVAEKVFPSETWFHSGADEDDCDRCGEGGHWKRALLCSVPPYFSEDIGAAWLVVDRMRSWSRIPGIEEKGCVDLCVKVCAGDGYWCDVFELSPMGYADQDWTFPGVDSAWADTAPLAICRAALRAVGAT